MTLLRGRKVGLEIALAGWQIDEALDELDARLAERPGFYRATPAVANFGSTIPSTEQFHRLRSLCAEAGIELRALAGTPPLEPVARDAGLPFEPVDEAERELDRRRALRLPQDVRLSEAARSLVADFAGARADIAERRRRGDSSVPRLEAAAEAVVAAPEASPAPSLHLVEPAPETLYHTGTLRGGQALHHLGNVVVVGDVNPGAELIASGDVLVFGRLAGVAHAGAQGDEAARVYALDLDATQLRIAAFIAADDGATKSGKPEVALVRDGRIVVVPFEHLAELGVPNA
ncbi:MAG TPA: septum site-determining protein MinC [Candidatus Acidoferrales bacterium]|nr:septum site-determining protein MinC [Candidatus Acidoferrales bacterium]